MAKVTEAAWKQEVGRRYSEASGAQAKPPGATVRRVRGTTFVRLECNDRETSRLAQVDPSGMLLDADELAYLFLNMSRYSGGQDNEFWWRAERRGLCC